MFWVLVFFAAFLWLLATLCQIAYRKWRPIPPAPQGERRGGKGVPDKGSDADSGDFGDFAWAIVGSRGFAIGMSLFLMFFTFWETSVVNPGGTQIAQFDRIYLCSAIKDGRNIAVDGECGRQARIEMPGFHIQWFVGVLNNVSYANMITVPDGHYAMLSARDGMKLDEGQVAARPWRLGDIIATDKSGKKLTGNMLDAEFFLGVGHGQKGPQTTILPPGTYPINTYLWDVQVDKMVDLGKSKDGKDLGKGLSSDYVRTTIPTGFVGVVKSAINEDLQPAFFTKDEVKVNCEQKEDVNTKQIHAVLVPVGCR